MTEDHSVTPSLMALLRNALTRRHQNWSQPFLMLPHHKRTGLWRKSLRGLSCQVGRRMSQGLQEKWILPDSEQRTVTEGRDPGGLLRITSYRWHKSESWKVITGIMIAIMKSKCARTFYQHVMVVKLRTASSLRLSTSRQSKPTSASASRSACALRCFDVPNQRWSQEIR